MKKWIKGFCIAAVALICFGLVLCIGGVAAGGAMTATGIIKDLFERHGVYYGTTIVTTRKHMVPDGETENLSVTKYSADVIRNLEIEADAAEVIIVESESADEFGVYTNDRKVDARVKKGTLVIERHSPSVNDGKEKRITLEIPKDFSFEDVEISVGAGVVEIQRLAAADADFEIGAGEIIVHNGNLRSCDVEVGVGNFEYEGIIYDGMNRAECKVGVGMGSAEFRLKGSLEDYNYRIECAAGNIIVGDETYSGLANETYIGNHAEAEFEIECAMGNVEVNFEGGNTDEEIDEVL